MIIDLILVAILILNLVFGLKRGFFDMLGRLIMFALSLAVTLLLLGPLNGALAKAPFLAPLADKLGKSVLDPLQKTAANIGVAIDSFKLPPFLARLMQSELPTPDNSVTQAYPEFTAVLFKFALNAALFVLMFAIVSLAVHFLAKLLTHMSDKVPVLGTANRLGGLLAGLLLGLVQVSILLLAAGFLVPYLPAAAELLADSRIAAFFYSINILAFLV